MHSDITLLRNLSNQLPGTTVSLRSLEDSLRKKIWQNRKLIISG